MAGVAGKFAGRSIPWTGVWGVGDQALVSATNFITLVLLARALAPRDYGVFLLVYMAGLFLNELQRSLFTRPHNVLAAPLMGARYAVYTGTAAALQALFAVCSGVLLLAGALIAYASGWEFAALLVALAPAAVAWQMQEFVRQTFYTRGKTEHAFACDVISYGGQTLLIVVLFAAGRLNGTSALYVLAVTSAVSALWGFWVVRRDLRRPEWSAMKESWDFGRWLLGDGIGGWLSAQVYPLLTAAIVGVTGVAVLRAVQNLIAPGHVIMNAFLAYAVPNAARVQDSQGSGAMKAFVFAVSAIAAAPLLVGWAVVSVLAVPALKLLYGDTYADYGPLVALTALAYCAHYVTLAQSAALLALGRTDAMFGGRLVAIVLTFSAGILLVWWLGVYGAIAGSAVSFVGLALFLAWALHRSYKAAETVVATPSVRGSLAAEG